MPLDTSNLGCNSWLAGFSDADAYFQVSLPPQSGGQFGKIKCFYRLECQQNYHRESDLVDSSYLPIMQQIADYFNTKLVTRDRITNYGNSSTCFVYTTNLQSNTIVYNYFTSYPMYSSKYLDFLEWSKVYNHRMLGTHLTIEGAKECLASKNSMNKNRITWNWDHLNNFPK